MSSGCITYRQDSGAKDWPINQHSPLASPLIGPSVVLDAPHSSQGLFPCGGTLHKSSTALLDRLHSSFIFLKIPKLFTTRGGKQQNTLGNSKDLLNWGFSAKINNGLLKTPLTNGILTYSKVISLHWIIPGRGSTSASLLKAKYKMPPSS